MKRPDWDTYFINMALSVASRSTCDRKSVGALFVRDRTVLSTGYNGSMRGLPHCDEVGHLMEEGHCTRVIHAEQNAIVQAARHGTRIEGSALYVTASPCWTCFKLVVNVGVRRIIYREFYRDERIFGAAKELGIELLHLPAPVEQEGETK
jgi:dCMP deaminase